jgi:hypothetical protein
VQGARQPASPHHQASVCTHLPRWRPPLPLDRRSAADLRAGARPRVEHGVRGDLAAGERDLERDRLLRGRVGRVVALAGGVDGDDEPLRAADDEGLGLRPGGLARERDVREAGGEDDVSKERERGSGSRIG